MIAAALLAVVSTQAVPPPLEQVVANCAAPVYATDQLVCGDAGLAQLDDAMGDLLGRWRPAPIDGLAPWRETQAEWFKRRSLCAFKTTHRQCVFDAYTERMEVLRALTAPAAPEVPSYRCDHIRGTVSSTGALVLLVDGKPAGAAVRRSERSGWQPYLRLDGAGSKLRITPSGGKPIRCVRLRP